MNIHFNHNIVFFTFEKVSFPNISPLNRKILGIASAVFAVLGLLFVVKCFWNAIKVETKTQLDPDSDKLNKATRTSLHLDDKKKQPGEKSSETDNQDKILEDTQNESDKTKTIPQSNSDSQNPTIKETRRYADGRVERGRFIKDKLSGQGEIDFPNGYRWEGEFKDGILNGLGMKIFKRFQLSEKGTYKDGKLNGPGERINPLGENENGEFVDDNLNGKGKITFYDGSFKEGQFKDGYLVEGKCVFYDGEVQEGTFIKTANGLTLLNGQGKITYPDKKVEEGQFVKGELVEGKLTFPDGGYQEGKFEAFGGLGPGLHRSLNGKGKQYFAHGELRDGNFYFGIFASGKIIHPNNEIWEGTFVNALLEGPGKKVLADGTTEDGEYQNNLLHGAGERIYPDGRKEKGIFEYNKLIRPVP